MNTYEYDSDGRKTVWNNLAEDGTINSYELYEYNEDGKLARSTSYLGDGSITGKDEYDDQGRQVHHIYYRRKDGTKEGEYYIRYLEDGTKLHKSIYYRSDGTIWQENDWKKQ